MLFFLCWIIGVILTPIVMSNKGRGVGVGLLLGIFLGVFGLLISLLIPENKDELERVKVESGENKKCEFCFSVIPIKSTMCKFCGGELSFIDEVKNDTSIKNEIDRWKNSLG